MPSLSYKENAERCFYVSGPINDEMVKALLPTINKLRLASNDPITVYIDSNGGDIHAADTIRSLATAPDPNGNTRELVTVSIGTSASAAADMLAHGDHAIAYEHSFIVYHGTRQNQRTPLTFEDATSLASSLRQTNEMFAMRLARRIFRRILYPISQLKAFPAFKNSSQDSLGDIFKELTSRLSGQGQRLVKHAESRGKAISSLTENILKTMRIKGNKQPPKIDLEQLVLKAIITFKTKSHKGDGAWSLSDSGLDEVVNDYKMFDDFYFGYHNIHRTHFTGTYGALLLSQSQSVDFNSKTFADESEKRKWLVTACGGKIQQLWYFCVSLSRTLQTDDFFLTPHDAYWLGLVDEVPGSDLVPLRSLAPDLQTHLSQPMLPNLNVPSQLAPSSTAPPLQQEAADTLSPPSTA